MTTCSRWERRKKSKFRARSGQRFIRGCRRPRKNSVWRFVPMRAPRRDISTAPIISVWRAWAFHRSRSIEGMKFKGHDEAWGLAQDKEYAEKHYHQPSDEYHPEMDFVGDAAMARFGFALGWEAASLPRLIGWQKGDEFEAAR